MTSGNIVAMDLVGINNTQLAPTSRVKGQTNWNLIWHLHGRQLVTIFVVPEKHTIHNVLKQQKNVTFNECYKSRSISLYPAT